MKLAIIELEDHVECIYSLVKVMSCHTDNVRFFINEKIFSELKYMPEFRFSHIDVTVMKKSVSVEHFLKDNFDSIDECAILFFTTIQKKIQSYSLSKFKGIKILRIHNANTFSYKTREWSLDFDPYVLWKDFSFYIREVIYSRLWSNYNRLKKEIDYFIFPDECILTEVKENKLYPEAKLLGAMPLACMSSKYLNKPKIKNRFRIVITGVIDKRRKDYNLVLEAVKFILNHSDQNIIFDLVLLGKPKGPYGKNIIKAFKALQNSRFKLKTFEKRIKQVNFEEEMEKADLLLAPIQIETRYKYFKETYGLTKQSGSISDLIRYAKPLVVPQELTFEECLSPYIFRYCGVMDLVKVLTELIIGSKTKQIDFGNLAIQYSPQAIYDNLMELINEKIEN